MTAFRYDARLLSAVFVALVSLLWASCAGTKKTRTVPDFEEAEQASLRKTQQEMLLSELRTLDSQSTVEEQTELVYILALDNFITLEEHDRRIPKIIMWKVRFEWYGQLGERCLSIDHVGKYDTVKEWGDDPKDWELPDGR